jgi:hypothetical protein
MIQRREAYRIHSYIREKRSLQEEPLQEKPLMEGVQAA